ncbi:leucyl/phenylalanyl-tRNA--protein transferase [Acetobacter senegalensis]|uniref:Leucyl/phenylalanyl-tRNA--protein transferase n=2 Tax=Acetobacter TaxID=434 RepID=A0A252EG13_9PROT|nr:MULTISPECIES: leucyl/phenylalanyl-tRNA--protein transferase [Acetobacter]ATJ91162.1 leucyl/phenylalanyl-tRNA--protein transferase [Acetobacter tropicalis]KAA8389255.1 leucyl/phenylalanyl-tRNA--protein transferase [Acetobacter tropicalis]KAA8392446.1 leucyl/phenylalanyl-tRNA--protein transferase [Acetobacter tropicalis]KGB26093.1 Leucyl/phenylalanyl-tRNA--protein transferase [Acetobacter tropicalis]MBC9008288.1 leucyl/phenylalanyl-tRNA--protein transferase [Acetobacter tropicalis]
MSDQGLTPELMLGAYAVGLFPMAADAEDEDLQWYDPDPRGVLPLQAFHLPRRLRRTVLSGRFDVTVDQDFPAVMKGCAAPAPGREQTWINSEIFRLFCALHEMGYAHSVECRQNGELVGGLYGVALGGAFFGESMFSRVTDASKVALVHLVARLRLSGFMVLDTQFGTDHLTRFGGVEIPAAEYKTTLERAVHMPPCWQANFTPQQLEAEIRTMRQGS